MGVVSPQNSTNEIAGIIDSAKSTVENRFEAALSYGNSAQAACEIFSFK